MFEISESDLFKAWKDVYLNKPRKKRDKSRGIDGITISQFKANHVKNLSELYRRVNDDSFEFKPLKEYEIIRKGKKKPRLIQAPTVADRIVQKVLSDKFMDLFAQQFSRYGVVGSIKGQSIANIALKAERNYQDGFVWVLKTDIIDFFPSINTVRLKKIFYRYLLDKRLRFFFNKYCMQSKRRGIPQGTPISPFLANLYLYDFDRALDKKKNIRHFRYIDDLIVFCRSKEEAIKIFKEAERFFKSVRLEVHPYPTKEKTFVEPFDSGRVDVLGVIYKEGQFYIKPSKYKKFIEEKINPIQFKSSLADDWKRDPDKAVKDLIVSLRHIVNGWAGAYAFCEATDVYKMLDSLLRSRFEKLLKGLDFDEIEMEAYIQQLPKFSNALNPKRKKRNK